MPNFDDYFSSEYTPPKPEQSPLDILTGRYEKRMQARERAYWSTESVRFRQILGRSAQILRAYDIPTEPHILTIGATRSLVQRRRGGYQVSDWKGGHEVVDTEGWHLLPDTQSYFTDRGTQRFLSAGGNALTHSNRATVGLARDNTITSYEARLGDPVEYEGQLYISSEITWRDFVIPSGDIEGEGNFFIENDELKFSAQCVNSYCDHTSNHIVTRSFEAEFASTVVSALNRFQKKPTS